MDRLEAKHDELASDLTGLKGQVGRVELNQHHSAELTQLRFSSLDTAVAASNTKLDGFLARFESMLTGEMQTSFSRDNTAAAADLRVWRQTVEDRLSDPEKLVATRGLNERVDKLEASDSKTRMWIAGAAAIVALIAIAAPIIAPIVIHFIP